MSDFVPFPYKDLNLNQLLQEIDQEDCNKVELIREIICTKKDKETTKEILYKISNKNFDIDMNTLELFCILYLQSINFNFDFFIKKTKINEKHKIQISSCNECEPYEMDILKKVVLDYYEENITIRYLRIFVVQCLLNIDSKLLPFDILYFIKYLIQYDSTLISRWIKNKPSYINWDIININNIHTFPFIELKYRKNIPLLFKISCNSINYKFIDFIIKQTKFTDIFYKLIVDSHCISNLEFTILICNYIRNYSYDMYNLLIKKLMIKDKKNLNVYFVSNIQNINDDVIDIFLINYKLLKMCNSSILSMLLRNSKMYKFIKNDRICKCFIKRLIKHEIMNFNIISSYINNPKMILYIYKKFDIPRDIFYSHVNRFLKDVVNNYRSISDNNGSLDLSIISNSLYNDSTDNNIFSNDSFNNYSLDFSINNYSTNNNNSLDFSIYNNCTNNSINNYNTNVCIINSNNIINTYSTNDISHKKKIRLIIKLFFIYNNPNISSKLIYKLYLINKKMFLRYFNRFMTFNTLYIKIYKILPFIKHDFSKIPTDYWGKAIRHKISKNNEDLIDGLYFNKSYIKFSNTSKYFTLNIFLIQYDKTDTQNIFRLVNKDNIFILGIDNGKMYYQIIKEDIKIYKNIISNNNNIYIELSVNNNKLNLLIDGNKYIIDIFYIEDVFIGEGFKGLITKLLYFEDIKYKKSRILHLDKSELYIKVIKYLEMYCTSKSIRGIFIKSKKVYWWYKKTQVHFYNVLEIK